MNERVHTIVAGAGVVGLAIARAEAMAGREVLILEADKRCGKLLVATDEDEVKVLDRCAKMGEANGLSGDEALGRLSAEDARELEPELRCVSAMLSPATGIVDSHQLMLATASPCTSLRAVGRVGPHREKNIVLYPFVEGT